VIVLYEDHRKGWMPTYHDATPSKSRELIMF
jgi:hypothetical protein